MSSSAPYVAEQVKALLNTALWYARLKNFKQVDKAFSKAVALVENEGGLREPDLHDALEEYAVSFRRAGRMGEADRLSELARRLRAGFPGLFHPDGSEIPWWKQPACVRDLPALPLELKASRAKYSSAIPFFAAILGATAAGGFLISTVFRPLVTSMGDGVSILLYLTGILLSGVLAQRWYHRALERQGRESRCRLTEEGIEYHEPAKHRRFRWSEIDRIWSDWGSGEEEIFDAVVVTAGKREFRLSARFFTPQEVRWVDTICRLKSDAAGK